MSDEVLQVIIVVGFGVAADIAKLPPGVNHFFRLSRSPKPGDVIVLCRHMIGVTSVKKLSLAVAAMLALLSIAGCAQYYGKGKAPPPVVTKG